MDVDGGVVVVCTSVAVGQWFRRARTTVRRERKRASLAQHPYVKPAELDSDLGADLN